MPKPERSGDDDARYDAALAAGLLIVEMLQDSPDATEEKLLSFITYTVLEAIHAAEQYLGGFQAQPSVN